MSILCIKGFNMPKDCGDCEFTVWDQENGLDVCPFYVEDIWEYYNANARHPKCPLFIIEGDDEDE